MRSRDTAAWWMGSAFCAAFVLMAGVLAILGVGERGTDAALAATARLSFLLFWAAYAGSALAALFGPMFQPLKHRAREFGLAFAAAHTVHIGLVAWLCWIGATPGISVFVFFGIALVWTYLLALFSLGNLQRALGPRLWWALRTLGMNYIALAFFVDFVKFPLYGGVKHAVEYWPFAILAVGGPLLRLSAQALRLRDRLRPAPLRTS